MPAAAAQPLIVGADDDVAFLDKGLDARQSIIRPRVAIHEEVLVEPLRRAQDLGRPAVLRGSRRAVRPRHDGAATRRRRPHGGYDQSGDDGFPPRYVRGDIRDAPSLRPGDRSRYQLLADNLPQRAFGTYLADGLVEGRSLWLSHRRAAARSNRKPDSHRKNQHRKNQYFLQGRAPRCRIPTPPPNNAMSVMNLNFIYGSILLKNNSTVSIMSCRATKPKAQLL